MGYFKQLFQGRINRLNFLVGQLLLIIAGLAGVYLIGVLFLLLPLDRSLFSPVEVLWIALAYTFSFSLNARRWHDLGYSGWLSFINFIPAISTIFDILLLVFPGQKKKNKYGDDTSPYDD